MTISTVSELIAARGGASRIDAFSTTAFTTVATRSYSFWSAVKASTGVGATPTTAETCTSAMAGALAAFSNPTAPAKTYLDDYCVNANTTINGVYFLCDRLCHMGGLSGTSTSLQTVNLTLPTDANRCDQQGYGVEWYLEWYTATGATASTASISYTMADGTASTKSVSLAASQAARTIIPIPLSSGDGAIKSVQGVTLLASTGTVGNFGVTARRKLIGRSNYAAHIATPPPATPMILVPDDACLDLILDAGNTSTGDVRGHFRLIQG